MIYVASDTHLGHRLMVEKRPWASLEEHDQTIIKNWNSVVTNDDTVFHLGDVVMNKNKMYLASYLNGKKILVMGNHEHSHASEYLKYFDNVMACAPMDWTILTHIPIHESQLSRFKTNIHGHLHSKCLPNRRYYCASMERISYTPKSLESIKEIFLDYGKL